MGNSTTRASRGLAGLKRLAGGGLLLLELRGMRRELTTLTLAVSRIAEALERQNAHRYPTQHDSTQLPATTEVSYADTDTQQEFADIELRLTAAKGLPPTEDEILAEFERRHQGDEPQQSVQEGWLQG